MNILAVDPAAPWIIKAGAETLLLAHIGGGTTGIISGAVALFARKGGRLHRIAGTVFVIAMLTMAGIGASVSGFLPTGVLQEAPNIIAGTMTFYLVLTSWVTIRRRDGGIGPVEQIGFAVALSVFIACVSFIIAATHSSAGTIGNNAPEEFYLFTLVGGIAAASDLKVILTGGIAGAPRIARHLWRMCTGLAIAAGSFFLGQQKFLPVSLQGSALMFIPVLTPLVLMAFWLVRVRVAKRTMRVPAIA